MMRRTETKYNTFPGFTLDSSHGFAVGTRSPQQDVFAVVCAGCQESAVDVRVSVKAADAGCIFVYSFY